MIKAKVRTAKKTPKNFEEAMRELETLIVRAESGEMPLDQAVGEYRRGAELVAYCKSQLAEARREIEILDGGLLRAFDDSEIADEPE